MSAAKFLTLVNGIPDLAALKLPGFIDGWNTANNVTDPTNDINFGTGVVWISDVLVELSSALTKRLDAAWAAGNNQGGLFFGSKASSTWYHCFAMYNPTTGAVDAGFDTSVSGANKPSGWNVRRIWSIQTKSDGSIRLYTQIGDYCIWKDSTVYSNSSIGTSQVFVTLTVPTGIQVEPLLSMFYSGTAADYLHVGGGDQNNEVPDFTQGRLAVQSSSIAPVNSPRYITNTSGQIWIRQKVGGNSDTLYLLVWGYVDWRGKR